MMMRSSSFGRLRGLPATACLGLALIGMAGLSMGAACGPRGGTNPDPTGDDGGKGPTEPVAAPRVEIDLFAFGRQMGTIAPCGCTTEPLGGLQYAFGYIEAESSPGERLVIEPGAFLFPDPLGPEPATDEASWAQAEQRADILQGRFSALGDGLVSGLGPSDLASPHGAAALGKWAMPRVLTNLDRKAEGLAPEVAAIPASTTVPLARGMKAGALAVVDPSLPGLTPAEGAEGIAFPALTAPAEAVQAEAAKLREAGADLVVVTVHGTRDLAESIARDVPGLDVVVMAGVLGNAELGRTGQPVTKVGDAYLVQPGDRGQTMTHLTLKVLEDKAVPGALPGASKWTLQPSAEQQREELARVEERLAKFKADPDADPGFIANLEKERDALKKSVEGGGTPEGDAVAVFAQIKVTCHRATDGDTAKRLAAYDGWVAEQNKKRFTGVFTPDAAKGEATYVGIDECDSCHGEAVEHWKTTVHAGAYETLEVDNKQFDLTCASCHVTGWRKPGGAELVETRGLVDVQCEQCHGPGSIHVDDPTVDNIRTEVPQDVCGECHTPEHSDTFEYDAYLRDVLGEGHGAKAREALGDGPTGRELRAAGLAKAGGSCKKMKM